MGNEVPHWTEDKALSWVPERPFAIASEPRPGPWSPRPTAAQAVPIRRLAFAPWRIAIGLGQGAFFYFLLHSRAIAAMPGADPFLFDALALATLFAPLLLIEGLGAIALRRLLPFVLFAAAILGALGWYHRWRIFGASQSHAGASMLLLAAAALFAAQAFLHGRERSGGWRIAYADLFTASWTLAARLLLWGLACAAGLSLLHAPLMPPLHLEEGDAFAMPLLGLTGALAFQFTAALPRATAALKDAMVATATIALLPALAAALFLVSAAPGQGPASLVLILAAMLALTLAISASHRGGGAQTRRVWRDGCEIFGALLLLALAALAVWALELRVAVFGWTAMRIFAAAAVTMFLAYGAGYSISAAITLARGGNMRGIEIVNPVLGVALMLGCLILASPLADPMRLAAGAQTARLLEGRTAIERFDFGNLPRDSARFGTDALNEMARGPYSDIATAAALARDAGVAEAPNPAEIGANIAVRTLGARMPAALLARNWNGMAGLPPCLTSALQRCDAYFLDLDGDGGDEILLVSGSDMRWWGAVMKTDLAGRWSMAGRIAAPACGPSMEDLRAGRFTLAPPLPGFRDMMMAGMRLSVVPSGSGCTHY